MFRTRPPAFALACVALWGMQLLMDMWVLRYVAPEDVHSARLWQWADMACTIAMGVLLLMQLPRALRWQPRRQTRPSPEVQLERQRIARDLHDHVGAQLVNVMSLLDARDDSHLPVMQALEQCMLDVRLLVDFMDSADDSLADNLARLRHRVQPVLDHRGVHLQWQVDARPEASMPVGVCARELTCVAREAISNVLQHAQATEVVVELAHARSGGGGQGEWHLRICDNGRGLPPPSGTTQGGHGIAGMQQRARSAGGSMVIQASDSGGACIHVVVPARA